MNLLKNQKPAKFITWVDFYKDIATEYEHVQDSKKHLINVEYVDPVNKIVYAMKMDYLKARAFDELFEKLPTTEAEFNLQAGFLDDLFYNLPTKD